MRDAGAIEDTPLRLRNGALVPDCERRHYTGIAFIRQCAGDPGPNRLSRALHVIAEAARKRRQPDIGRQVANISGRAQVALEQPCLEIEAVRIDVAVRPFQSDRQRPAFARMHDRCDARCRLSSRARCANQASEIRCGTMAPAVSTRSTANAKRTVPGASCGRSSTMPVTRTSRSSHAGGSSSASRTCARQAAYEKPDRPNATTAAPAATAPISAESAAARLPAATRPARRPRATNNAAAAGRRPRRPARRAPAASAGKPATASHRPRTPQAARRSEASPAGAAIVMEFDDCRPRARRLR